MSQLSILSLSLPTLNCVAPRRVSTNKDMSYVYMLAPTTFNRLLYHLSLSPSPDRLLATHAILTQRPQAAKTTGARQPAPASEPVTNAKQPPPAAHPSREPRTALQASTFYHSYIIIVERNHWYTSLHHRHYSPPQSPHRIPPRRLQTHTPKRPQTLHRSPPKHRQVEAGAASERWKEFQLAAVYERGRRRDDAEYES